jgi:hypothetical protein
MTKPESFDPEVVATLEAIDATLAGEPVDPRHADMAELAVLLADERPRVDPAFAILLDEGVQRRFESARQGKRPKVTWWVWAPSAAVAASLAVAIVIVLGQGSGGSSSNGVVFRGAAAAPKPKEKRAVHQRAAASRTFSLAAPRPPENLQGVGSGAAAGPAYLAPAAGHIASPQTVTPDRKVIQGARLSLSTTSKRVDTVAQEVFNVIAQQKGIVKSSQVTANGGHGGYAQFQLSVPGGNLAATMGALSNLQYAQVASRTDTTQDVTNQFRVDQRRLGDDRALRTALLKQLASAVTQAEIDSLKARIHDAEGAISSDENALHALNRSVGYSQIFVTINAGAPPVPAHKSGGFTVGRAAHDAGHVLTVAAGVALIGLAALLPLALVLALAWWIYATLRRRGRMQALDQL